MTDQQTPERSLAQRLDALQRANEVRSARAELKRRMKRCAVSPAEVIVEPMPVTESMKVWDVLLATPKVGRVKASKILRDCQVSPSKTVAGLTPRQREKLARRVRG